jgi:tetratricopeptide (TPR) repeat protein
MEGRWDEALTWFESDRATRLKAGNPVGAANAALNTGEIFAKQGRIEEAEPLLREAIRVMRASGFHDGAAYAELQLGRVLIARGAPQQADELLERVQAELMQIGRKSSAAEAAVVQSLAKIRLGHAEDALELIDRAEAAIGENMALSPQIAESRARALAALGRIEEAESHLAHGLAAARNQGLVYEEGVLLRTRVELRRLAGREVEMEDAEKAEKILGVLGVRITPSTPGVRLDS